MEQTERTNIEKCNTTKAHPKAVLKRSPVCLGILGKLSHWRCILVEPLHFTKDKFLTPPDKNITFLLRSGTED